MNPLFFIAIVLGACSGDGRLVGTWGVEPPAAAGLDAASQARVLEGVARTLSTVKVELAPDGGARVSLGAAQHTGRYRVIEPRGDHLTLELALQVGEHTHTQRLPVVVLGDRLQLTAPDGQALVLRRWWDPGR